jgi:pimeloyl-ACP methyl ester carboxylesterase
MEKIVFRSEGLEIHGCLYETAAPETRTVVFCHGAFEFQENWADYAARMNAGGLPAFTFDFAGHGESQGIRSLVNLRVWAYNLRDALSALEVRGYGPFALVGWDIGGSAALLACAHDRRLDCAVLLSTPIVLQPPIGERLAYGLISTAAAFKKAVFKRSLTLSRLNELEGLRFLSEEDANEQYFSNPKVRNTYAAVPIPDSLDSVWMDIRKALQKVSLPVLVMHGSEDAVLPVEQSRELYRLLKGSKELLIVDSCGHALHLDQKKDEVFDKILGWIKNYLSS